MYIMLPLFAVQSDKHNFNSCRADAHINSAVAYRESVAQNKEYSIIILYNHFIATSKKSIKFYYNRKCFGNPTASFRTLEIQNKFK